ncbi:MAG: phosphodiester glycosidase family protein, partial [Kamptonema sp. SIO4C4]|nr:phosphodiester glycosidase family protein [Kamptonema sp. SIO4C4]
INLLQTHPSGVKLRPIWGEPPSMTGTEPLVTMGRRWRVLAAINGGFFNRDNRLPLGAIRRDNQWFSGPILNRAAIAWDDQGNVKIDRLYLREVLTTPTGQRVFISHLNSGYVQAGVARYTPAWGRIYTPLTDNETLIMVRNNQITRHLSGNAASRFPIPEDGYILTIRANSLSPQQLPVGTPVQLTSETIPDDFTNYPHIIGAGPLLLRNGGVVLNGTAEKFSNAFNRQTASRSAIGKTGQGTLILAAVHNRVGGKGPNLRELAQVMQRLGVVDALNLDGGSSTSLYLHDRLIDRPASTAARVHNAIGIYVRQD